MDRIDVVVAVLAGGAGERLGGGKAAYPLGGRPLISYPLEAALAAGLEAFVVAREDSELPEVDVPVVHDPPGDRHPLRGIATALDHEMPNDPNSSGRRGSRAVIAVACDMPFVSPAVLTHLASATGLVVPRLGGRLHPLLARYEQPHLAALREACEQGLGAQRTIAALNPAVLEAAVLQRFGEPERLLFNVNTAEDAGRAEALLAE